MLWGGTKLLATTGLYLSPFLPMLTPVVITTVLSLLKFSQRAYKEAFTHEQAREYIRQHSGSQFDPDVVAAFLAREEEFRELARRFGDGQDPRSTQREVPAAR